MLEKIIENNYKKSRYKRNKTESSKLQMKKAEKEHKNCSTQVSFIIGKK